MALHAFYLLKFASVALTEAEACIFVKFQFILCTGQLFVCYQVSCFACWWWVLLLLMGLFFTEHQQKTPIFK